MLDTTASAERSVCPAIIQSAKKSPSASRDEIGGGTEMWSTCVLHLVLRYNVAKTVRKVSLVHTALRAPEHTMPKP
jgi:hypothetical protein